MHSVIHYGDGGQVHAISRHSTEDQVAAKRNAMSKAGQKSAVLWHADISTKEVHLLVWDEEQGRLTRRADSLVELRAPLLERLKQHHGLAVQADMETAQGIVQGDGHAQSVAMIFALRIRAGEASPHGGFWHMRDNSNVTFGDDDVLALDQAFSARAREMQARAWSIVAQIRAETDPAVLKAMDIAVVWDEAAQTGA